MTSKEHWERLSEAGWRKMAEDWLAGNREKPADLMSDDYQPSEVDLIVTGMKFDASAEKQWQFILLTTSLAETDWQLGQIGAELIEHLLGWPNKWNGKDYVSLVEEEAKTNKNLARSILSVNQYLITDEIWMRVHALQQQTRPS